MLGLFCRLWRSTFHFPSYLSRPSYSLPAFNKFPLKDEHLCTLEKVPLFLFRVLVSPVAAAASTSELYFLGGIGRDESEDRMELPSPIQCSVKVMMPGSDPTIMNMLDCQILALGHQYRMSKLDEEAGEWVVVTDLGDRVLLIAQPVNSSCSAKELPDGCGVSGNSMLFIKEMFGVTYSYKYGVDTGNPEDDLNFWRSSRETRVWIINTSPMVALRVESTKPENLTMDT